MKVKELIERLQQYDGDMEVVVPGYEMGLDTIWDVRIDKAKRDNWNDAEDSKNIWYYGDWIKCDDGIDVVSLV